MCFMVPSMIHTSISILSRFGSQFHKYNFLSCKRVGRQSIRHPLNSGISVMNLSGSKIRAILTLDFWLKVLGTDWRGREGPVGRKLARRILTSHTDWSHSGCIWLHRYWTGSNCSTAISPICRGKFTFKYSLKGEIIPCVWNILSSN